MKYYTSKRDVNLGRTGAILGGYLLRDEIERELHREHVVEHVRDGKPLTAVGARLLGVPWKEGKCSRVVPDK